MIVYLDPFRLRTPSPGDFLVSDEATYVEARRRMLAHKRQITVVPPTIVVVGRVQTHWFGDVPTAMVQPRQQLQLKYPIALLPAALTDEDVMDLALLETAVEPTELGLRRHFFDNLLEDDLSGNACDPAWLLALAQFVAQFPAVFLKRYLMDVWQGRLATLPKGLASLRNGDAAFGQALAEGIYLGGIPALFTDWEHSHAVSFSTTYGVKMAELMPIIGWTKRRFPDDPVLEAVLKDRLLNQLTSSNRKALMPGIYRAELEALLSTRQTITSALKQELEAKYEHLLTPVLRERLQAMVPPTLHQAPAMTGLSVREQAEAWRSWAVTSFIPYKFWLDNVSAPTAAQLNEVDTNAEVYGDWLFGNWAALSANNDVPTTYGVREQVLNALGTAKSRVIWLIIDGFPAVFVPLLEQQLRTHGLSRQTKHYAFAPLPTISEIGIPAQLNGLMPDSSSYTTDPRIALSQAFPGHKTAYAGVVGKFQDVLSSDADLCCLHWLEIDEAMHLTDNKFDSSTGRLEHVTNLLDKWLGKLAHAMGQQTNRPTKLVISTDHGTTKCLRDGMNITNVKITQAAANFRERSVRLEGKLLSVHLDEIETYHLTTDITRNPVAYVAARGYRYFGANDRGYRHGGLTPEETIVPVIVAEMPQFAVALLQLTYYGNGEGVEQGKTLKEFRIQVRNPNTFAVEITTLMISEDTNSQFALPLSITANNTGTLTGVIKITLKDKPKNGFLPLSVTVTYRANAEEFTQQIQVDVPIKTNEIDDIDFDNL